MAKISSILSPEETPETQTWRPLPASQGGTHLQARGACSRRPHPHPERGPQSHHGTAGKFFFSSEFQSAFLRRRPGSASGVTQSEPRLPSSGCLKPDTGPASPRLKQTPSPPRPLAGVACSPDPAPSCLAPSWPHSHHDAAPRTDRKRQMRPTADVAVTPLPPGGGGLCSLQTSSEGVCKRAHPWEGSPETLQGAPGQKELSRALHLFSHDPFPSRGHPSGPNMCESPFKS